MYGLSCRAHAGVTRPLDGSLFTAMNVRLSHLAQFALSYLWLICFDGLDAGVLRMALAEEEMQNETSHLHLE